MPPRELVAVEGGLEGGLDWEEKGVPIVNIDSQITLTFQRVS